MSKIQNLKQLFEQNLQSLLPESCTELVIALSGGLDSIVLLHLSASFAKNNGLSIIAINVDHGLSANAKDWQEFCAQQAEALTVGFIGKQVQVKPQARQSLEALARDLRYEALAPYCSAHSVLLTGHHNDDQLETYLLQLKRGAGIKGLSAMAASRQFASGCLLRPLLPFTRQQLSHFAIEQNFKWIEDESNLDQSFDRNFLRNNIIPQLTERWPGFGKAVVRSASLSAQAQQLCDEVAELDLQTLIADIPLDTAAINIKPLLTLSDVRRNNVIRFWIDQQGALLPSQQQLSQIWHNLALSRDDACGFVAWSTHQMHRYQGKLYLLLKPIPELEDIKLDKQLLSSRYRIAIANYPREIIFSVSEEGERLRLPLDDEQVSIRFNGSGQVCHPAGRVGSRKYKKLMHEYQIPPWLRQKIPLVFYNEQLVAACGYWLDERFLQKGAEKGLEPNRAEWHLLKEKRHKIQRVNLSD